VAITIDYSQDTYDGYVIQIPKADMLLVQSTPTEVRELNIDDFRTELNDLMDDEAGLATLVNHEHTAPKTVAGVTLARVVEIVEPFWVLFENGSYNVNIVGGNSNISDRVIKNTVGVNTANSAGLQDPFALQAGAFGDKVALDVTSAFSGTTFPRGTASYPVNNVADALSIAETRGLRTILVMSSMTLSSGDFSDGYVFRGINAVSVVMTLSGATDVTNCEFTNMTVTGTLDNDNVIRECAVSSLQLFAGFLYESTITGTVTLGTGSTAYLLSCYSGVAGGGAGEYPSIDFTSGAGIDLVVRGWSGGLGIKNCTSASTNASLDFESGRCIFESSNTAGDFTVRGICEVTDNSVGATVTDKTSVRETWDEVLETGMTMEGAMRIMLAVMAGKSSVEGSTITFRDSTDTVDRVTATMDGDKRTNIDLDTSTDET
jgi:hypothetical protein